MDTYAIIYLITNLVNQKVYVGFTSMSLKRRWNNHIKDSKKYNFVLYNAFNLYGIENFIIEEIYCSKDKEHTLKVMEPYFIKEYNSYIHSENSNGYNMTLGGEGSFGRKMSEYCKSIFCISRPHKEETKTKISESNKMVEHTEEWIKKVAISNTGKKRSPEIIEKYKIAAKWRYEKYGSPSKGIKRPEEIVDKRRQVRKFVSPNGEIIINKNLKKLCEENNLSYECMQRLGLGKTKEHRGYTLYQ